MELKDKILLILASVSAGVGWALIPSQGSTVLPEFSIAYRFFMASALLFLIALGQKKIQKIPFKKHFQLMIVGLFLYGLFCSSSYRATAYLPSGLVSLIIACMVLPNIFFERIFLKKKITPKFYAMTGIVLCGISLIFWNDVSLLFDQEISGVLLSILSIIIYAFGTLLFAIFDFKALPKIYIISLAMFYAAVFSLLSAFIITGSFYLGFDFSEKYLISLLSLGLYFSPIVLVIYLYLAEKVGSSIASYVWIGMPLISLNISAVFEGFIWSPFSLSGVILVLLGLSLNNVNMRGVFKKYRK
ncbi:MAG: DMT family transporter [Alphaproteobacteria bacterium]|jgi:drug/metabolite transporter (DMT)-like permease|nr:DMT family transporter [Alphaproteobacteria bacterium]